MLELSTNEYGQLLKICYQAKKPLYASGGPGIGKSAIPRDIFKKIAINENREFREWADLTLGQKKECIDRPSKYWIFGDMRTSHMDTTSLTGIPNMANTEMLENIPYSWVVYFTQKNAAGCIFFDEINLAPPIVQSITYSAIHDRVIADRRISPNIYIFAAGNRAQDKAHTFDMPAPLRDRFAECEVHHDVEQWIEWAKNAGINRHLIAFIEWKPANLYNIDKVKKEKFSTPRGVERASILLSGLNIDDFEEIDTNHVNCILTKDMIYLLVAASCGESFAREFQAYTRVYRSLNWDTILANPESIKEFSVEKSYAIANGILDKYARAVDDDEKGRFIDLVDYLQTDFAIFAISAITKDIKLRGDFIKLMQKTKKMNSFRDKYMKFVVDQGVV
jgi:hypothetical protein